MATQTEAPRELLYTSLKEEATVASCEVKGSIPSWLKGTLLRTGPSLFEIGDEKFKHWFDGQSMLYAFTFGDGKVSYTNRYLDSSNLRAHRAAGKIAVPEFGTDPCSSIFGRAKSMFIDRPDFQNANVNVGEICGKAIAMTEIPLVMEFDKETLATVGPVKFEDNVGGAVSTAHPHYGTDGHTINYVTRFGKDNVYVLFDIPTHAEPNAKMERRIIAEVPCPNAAYMHSFGLSENYIILAEFPWIFSLSKMISSQVSRLVTGNSGGAYGFFEWQPQYNTQFTVVSRKDGSIKAQFKSDAFFCYHHINSYEVGDKIHVDMMCYDRVGYGALLIDDLKKQVAQSFVDDPSFDGANVRRYTLDLSASPEEISTLNGGVQMEVISEKMCELPRINYDQVNGRPYRYVYGVTDPIGQANYTDKEKDPGGALIKLDVQERTNQVWYEPYCYAAEPVFTPAPNASKEDDGVVMSVVLDFKARTSFLLMLDGITFKEIARAQLPHHIPMGLHGRFFK